LAMRNRPRWVTACWIAGLTRGRGESSMCILSEEQAAG
jgi:hypothetical protein